MQNAYSLDDFIAIYKTKVFQILQLSLPKGRKTFVHRTSVYGCYCKFLVYESGN